MTEENLKEDIKSALIKKAMGYSYKEIIKEYSLNENSEQTLSKRKVTTKHVPPDITAVKLLLNIMDEENAINLDKLSDEEIEKEINALLEQSQKETNKEDNNE